jgi:glycosyltransferase involved in cell wall biosynthesis
MNNLSAVQLEENVDKDISEVTVSVIIATYRRDVSLRRALESVVQQTYKNIEIIVVDDNAEANWNKKVKDIIDDIYIQQPTIYIQNETNKGSAETRNIGINIASGEYITFLDDDDVYLPDKVKRQIEHMIINNSDYCVTDLDLYDENEKIIEKRTRSYIRENKKNELLRYHFMYHITGTDSLMFKSSYLIRIGGFPPINLGDEFYLMQKAIEAGGQFSYLPVCDIKAYVHIETDGLSSGESKIDGENNLHLHKKGHFEKFSLKEQRYINMRHYAVLSFAYLRQKKWLRFFMNSFLSLVNSPFQCLRLFYSRVIR